MRMFLFPCPQNRHSRQAGTPVVYYNPSNPLSHKGITKSGKWWQTASYFMSIYMTNMEIFDGECLHVIVNVVLYEFHEMSNISNVWMQGVQEPLRGFFFISAMIVATVDATSSHFRSVQLFVKTRQSKLCTGCVKSHSKLNLKSIFCLCQRVQTILFVCFSILLRLY